MERNGFWNKLDSESEEERLRSSRAMEITNMKSKHILEKGLEKTQEREGKSRDTNFCVK